MSTGKTNYLGLHRWEPDDDFLRTEFNENSDKLDEELEMMQKEMDGEFSAVRAELAEGLNSRAPAGYGLGEATTRPVAGIDAIKENGWHTFWVETVEPNGPPRGNQNCIATCDNRYDTTVLEVTSATGKIGRFRNGSSWSDWFTYLTTLNLASLNVCRIQSGSYTGTDSYGSGSPNRLTFSFAPKFVFVTSAAAKSSAHADSFLWLMGGTQIFNQAFASAVTATLSGNTLSWYCAQNAASQCNTSGVVYHYIAFG